MSDNNTERNMDLSGEDDELDIDEDDLAELTEDDPEPEDDEFDPQEEGKTEAKRVLKTVDGDSEVDRAENAIEAKQQSLQSMQQQYGTAQQNVQSMEQRLSGLEHTLEQLEDASDDQSVFQNLEGGVIVEVAPENRDSVREDIEDAKDGLEESLEEVRGRHESIERGVQKNRAAIQFLEMYKDLNDE